MALKRHIVCQIRVNLDTSEVPKLEWHLKSSVYGKSQPELLKIGTSHYRGFLLVLNEFKNFFVAL